MKRSRFIVFLGLPGSGKGTQAKCLVSNFNNFRTLSTGDSIRKILKSQSNNDLYNKLNEVVSKGLLVDDNIIFEIVKMEVLKFFDDIKNNNFNNSNVLINVSKNQECQQENNNFIFDGFPRTESQSVMIINFLKDFNNKLDRVLVFDIKKRIAIKRLLNRIVCKDCSEIYSCFGLKKKDIENFRCLKCGGEVIKRKDDNNKAIRTRLKNDKKIIDFLIKFYQNRNIKCVRLNAALKINVLNKKIKNIIDLL
jgi:adenylate kinase